MMPYEGEFAPYNKALKRLVENPRIDDLLKNSKIREREIPEDGVELPTASDLTPSGRIPDYIIAVDGSKQETKVRNGFPGAEVGYIAVATVMLDVALMRRLDTQRPASPKAYRKTESASSTDGVFPGCNVLFGEDETSRISLRRILFEHLSAECRWENGETFLETYEALLAYKPPGKEQRCPYMDDCESEEHHYVVSKGTYQCPCSHKRPLYSTDALRVHERMEEFGSNASIYQEIMQVLEHLSLINTLRNLERKDYLSSLRRVAFVMDGPLAVFGQPAWLSAAIFQELCRINRRVKAINGEDLLVVGVEKTGMFQEHLVALDTFPDGSVGRIPAQKVMLLTNDYIRKYIKPSEGGKMFGDQTYYGRKFFYKSKAGSLIVGVTPFLDKSHKDLQNAQPPSFPRLEDVLSLLDELHCARYPNALIPIVVANAEAAIPMNLGAKILERLAKELMGIA
jgi:hypothetical protein